MKVILFGATGMVGHAVLLECLDHPSVSYVLSISRRPTNVQHPKLKEILHEDFSDYSDLGDELEGCDACFFCLGVSSVGMGETSYRHITYDFTLAAARALGAINPQLVFCYVSGEGADSSETGRIMWARVRGKTENDLQRLPLAGAYVFRLGYVHPTRGVRSEVPWTRFLYWLLQPLYPLLSRLFPRYVTTSRNVARAMIRVAQHGDTASILRSDDINAAASM